MAPTSSTPDDWADKVEDLRERAANRTDEAVDRTKAAAAAVGDAASDAAAEVRSRAADASAAASHSQASAKANAQNLRDSASAIATDLKTQASAHVEDAKGVITSMADEARNRIAGIIDQQKAMGADKLSGISRAAHNAAADLDQQNPHMARLVRDAAGSVDMIAGNLRSSNVGDVIASVSSFARKQPVAFFAGSVLAGFALARFIKSEPTHPQSPSGDPQG